MSKLNNPIAIETFGGSDLSFFKIYIFYDDGVRANYPSLFSIKPHSENIFPNLSLTLVIYVRKGTVVWINWDGGSSKYGQVSG